MSKSVNHLIWCWIISEKLMSLWVFLKLVQRQRKNKNEEKQNNKVENEALLSPDRDLVVSSQSTSSQITMWATTEGLMEKILKTKRHFPPAPSLSTVVSSLLMCFRRSYKMCLCLLEDLVKWLQMDFSGSVIGVLVFVCVLRSCVGETKCYCQRKRNGCRYCPCLRKLMIYSVLACCCQPAG